MREAQVIVISCHPRNGTAWAPIALASQEIKEWRASGGSVIIVRVDGILADPPEQLRAFIRDGQITALPARRDRRRLLLDQVAQAFEPGRRYQEAQVDEVLKAIFHDHCALRRYLIDEAFMSRTAAGIYWRAGGTVE